MVTILCREKEENLRPSSVWQSDIEPSAVTKENAHRMSKTYTRCCYIPSLILVAMATWANVDFNFFVVAYTTRNITLNSPMRRNGNQNRDSEKLK